MRESTIVNSTMTEPGHSFDYDVLDTLELLLGGLLNDSTSYFLPGQAPSPNPAQPALSVPSGKGSEATTYGTLLLRDPDGTPLARLNVEASEAPGDSTYLAGPVSPMREPEHGVGRAARLTAPLSSSGDSPQVAAAFDRPPRAEELAQAVAAAGTMKARLRLIAVAANAAPGNRRLSGLVHTLDACAAELEDVAVNLLVVPGYDHEFAGTSRTLGTHVLDRIGAAQVLDFSSADEEHQEYADDDGESGLVVLFTGLSGSGKSTLARELVEQIHRVDTRRPLLLDGDDVRRFLTAGLGFTREDRNTNVERIGWVAAQVSAVGGIAVCAPIAPFEESRQRVRELAEQAGDYILVHVSTPLEVCEQRDRKGLYAKARAGEIPDFTGIDSPYDVPAFSDYKVDTSVIPPKQAVHDILAIVSKKGASRLP